MDFNQLEPTRSGVAMQLKHPVSGELLFDENKKAITITLKGKDTPEFQTAKQMIADREVEVRQKLGKKGNTAEGMSKQIEDGARELLSAVVETWSDNIELDGAKIKCTRAEVMRLFERFAWIQEQVDQFVGDRANFIKSSPKS